MLRKTDVQADKASKTLSQWTFHKIKRKGGPVNKKCSIMESQFECSVRLQDKQYKKEK